jgi:hypothetical protein
MKNILKFVFVSMVALGVMTSCLPNDNHTLKGEFITPDKVSFALTSGSDEFTFNYAVTVNGTSNAAVVAEIDFGDDSPRVRGVLPYGSHEFFGFARETFTITATVQLVSGVAPFVLNQTVTLPADNLRDNPSSLQYLLTGGMDNTDGKKWKLGAWSSMRNPDNLGEVWWNFYNDGGSAIQNDEFIFTPNLIRPNGGFTHVTHGDTFMNESLGNLFPDGNPGGSFVTAYYVSPTDATWEIVMENGVPFLIINKGFLGYATQPSDLESVRYQILEFSPERIRLRGSGNWFFELVPIDD